MNKELKWSHKSFKAAMIKMLQNIIMNSLEMRNRKFYSEVTMEKKMKFIGFKIQWEKNFKTQ